MHVEIDTPTLADIAEKATSFTARGLGSPLWLHAQNGFLTLYANGGDIDFYAERAAVITAPGTVGIYGNTFAPLLKSLGKGPVALHIENNAANQKNLHITQGRKKMRLPCLGDMYKPENILPPADITPESETESPYTEAIWTGQDFANAITRVLHCTSKDDDGGSLHCVNMQGKEGAIHLAGLNGHSMAHVQYPEPQLAVVFKESTNLTNKHARHLLRWMPKEDVAISRDKNRLIVRAIDKQEWLLLPLNAQPFYDYTIQFARRSICTGELHMPRTELQAALARAVLFQDAAVKGIIGAFFKLDADTVSTEKTSDSGVANESIPLAKPYTGNCTTIGLAAQGVQNLLDHFTSETVSLALSDNPESPVFITGENDPNYTVITMPMKVHTGVYYTEGKTA